MSRMSYIFILLLFSFQESNETNLTLEVKGMHVLKGRLMIVVFTNKASFPEADQSLQQFTFPVKAKKMKLTLTQLTKHESYAVAVYHDENNNEKLDKNMFGMPTERYGFSNNARGTFSAPSFEEAEIVFQKNKTISIDIY